MTPTEPPPEDPLCRPGRAVEAPPAGDRPPDRRRSRPRPLCHGPRSRGSWRRSWADGAAASSAVAVSSGSDALLIALLALGVGGGGNRRDAVFVPTFTFTATAEVVLLAGAVPVFVDVREEDFLIDLESLEREYEAVRAAGVATPKAVIPVDLFGLPVAEEPLAEWAASRQLDVISDAAQSFGAGRDGRPVGSLAPITTTSFYPAKPLGCYGDGGAVLCVEPATAEIVRSIREHGQERRSLRHRPARRERPPGQPPGRRAAGEADHLRAGAGCAARRRGGLRRAAAHRRVLGGDALDGCRCRSAAAGPESGVESSWAQYTLRVDDAAGRPSAGARDALRAHLDRAGIPTAVYYPRPMHLQPAYESYGRGAGSLPVSESLADRVVSLPMHPYLDQDALDRICERIANA